MRLWNLQGLPLSALDPAVPLGTKSGTPHAAGTGALLSEHGIVPAASRIHPHADVVQVGSWAGSTGAIQQHQCCWLRADVVSEACMSETVAVM